MSTCGFRGRGFVRRSSRPNGPVGGFAGPRFPHPNFNHTGPPPKRLTGPEKWGERPGGFLPWQANTNYQHRPQFRGNIHFRPNGRGRMPNGRGMVRFSGPGRPPGPQFPVGSVRLPMRPRAPFLNEGNTQEKIILSPLLGSPEERQQKICETADKLKQKLSSISQEEMMHFWEDDLTGELPNCASEQKERKGNKVIAGLRHGPPELDLTFTDLRDIGRVDSNKLESERCPEVIELIDHFDNDAGRFESTNDEISITYSNDNDVMVIPSTDIQSIRPNATISSSEKNNPHKGTTFEKSEGPDTLQKIYLNSEIKQANLVVPPYSDDSKENLSCSNTNASKTVGSFSHLVNDADKDVSVASRNATYTDVPETAVHGQQLKQTNIFDERQKESLIKNLTSKSPVLQKLPLHKQKCISLSDVPNENTLSDSLPSPSSNNEGITQDSNSTSGGTLTATYACQPFSSSNYPEVQISSGSGFCSKVHNELPSFASHGLNQKYHWQQKGSNCFPISPQNSSGPRMTSHQLNPVPITFSSHSLSNSLLTNSVASHNESQQPLMPVSSTDLPLNFDPAKPPPNIIPQLRSNKVNLVDAPVTFNTSLSGFNHQDSSSKMYNHDDSLRPQPIFSPHGFLTERSNLITITPTESISTNLMDMTAGTEFKLDSTAGSCVQLSSVPPSPHQPFIPKMQMNFSPIIPLRNTERVSHNLLPPVHPPIGVGQIQAPPTLPKESLDNTDNIGDPCEATINDGLEDMQEAMKFANQIMNMSEQMENTVHSEIPLPNVEAPLPQASPSNNKNIEQSSLNIALAPVEDESTSGEPNKNSTYDAYASAEKTLKPQNVEKIDRDEDTNTRDLSLIDELMRPKVIFNLNSKLKRISKVEDWHHHNEEARLRKIKSKSLQSSLQTSNTGSSKEGDLKKKKHGEKGNNGIELKKKVRPRILEELVVSKSLEKSHRRMPVINIKTINNMISQKPAKLKHCQSPDAVTAEFSWKNRVINRFLKMSKNDIRNMVNNSSLRKFDIAMKHLVKEKRSSLSLELRNTEDEKIKGYDQEEFMNQLTAMLDPSATVDISNLPTEFIHHLSEVLQLDPMPLEANTSLPPSIEVKEPVSNTHARSHTASSNIILEEPSPSSLDVQLESTNAKVVLDTTKDERQAPSLESNSSASDMPKRASQQSPLFLEEIANGPSMQSEVNNASLPTAGMHKTQRLLFNAADLDDILSVVVEKPKDYIGEMEESTAGPLRDNTTMQNQETVNDEADKFSQMNDCYETIPIKKNVNQTINISNARPRKSTSEDRSTFKVERCQRWSRKEREDLDAFRNLTKEEWEAKYGNQICSGTSTGSRRSFSNTRADAYRINRQYNNPERQYLLETSARNRSLSPVACESIRSNFNRLPNRHNGFAEPPRARRSRSMSTSSSSSSSNNEMDPVNSDVTKLLKVIKEKEKIAKNKSISETIRDEVTAEIERKRKEKSKYKEKKGSSKHSKRRNERRAKHKKRVKGKKRKRGLKSGSTETGDELGEHRLLGEDEIKKEVVVKKEVLTSPERNLSLNEITINSGTAGTETHNIVKSTNLPQISEHTTQLQSTAVLSTGVSSNGQQGSRNSSPCAMLSLQPKTKAQLKQMPEPTNADQACLAGISLGNEAPINNEANTGIEKKIEETQVEVDGRKPGKVEQLTDFGSAGNNDIALSEAETPSINLNIGKSVNPEADRISEIPDSSPTVPNPRTSDFRQSATELEKSIELPNCSTKEKCLDSSSSTITQNMSKNTTTKSKKIDIKVYKERALQRRLKEQGKLGESGSNYGTTPETSNRSICETIVRTGIGNPLTVKENVEVPLPGTRNNGLTNPTGLSVDCYHEDSHVPETLASSSSFCRKNGSCRYTENANTDNAWSNLTKTLTENNKLRPKVLMLATQDMQKSDTKVKSTSNNETKKISIFVGAEKAKNAKFRRNERKRQEGRKKPSNKSQEKDPNLLVSRRRETSRKDARGKSVNLVPCEASGVKGNHSNNNVISHLEGTKNENTMSNSKSASFDMTDSANLLHQFDSTTESTLHALTPVKLNKEHAKYSQVLSQDVKEEIRPIHDVIHADDRIQVSEELHSNRHGNQELAASCTEQVRNLPTLARKASEIEASPEALLISEDKCSPFEQQISELIEPSEVQTKESFVNQLLSLETNTMREEDTLQNKIHEAIIKNNNVASNKGQSGDRNDDDTTNNLKGVKEILLSHTSNTKESTNKDEELCNAMSAESSSSPFAGFGQEWNQDYMYNEKIACLRYGNAGIQQPSYDRLNPNLTENLFSEEPIMLPGVTSEVTVKTSLTMAGINNRIILNEEAMDKTSPNSKDMNDNSNVKISAVQPCTDHEHDLILTSEVPTESSARNTDSRIVPSEHTNTEDDNKEEDLKISTFKTDGYTDMEKNSADGDQSSELHPRDCSQVCMHGSPKDHNYSSKQQHTVNVIANVEKQCYSKPMSNISATSVDTLLSEDVLTSLKAKSANIVYNGDKSQQNMNYKSSLQEEQNEINDSNETNTVECASAPLKILSSKHNNNALYNITQEDKQESFKASPLDSSCSSVDVPTKFNVSAKAAQKGSTDENIIASSTTTSLKEPKDAESSMANLSNDTVENFQRNFSSIEVDELSKGNKEKGITSEAENDAILHTNPENPTESFELSNVVDPNDDLSPATDTSVSILSENKNNMINLPFIRHSRDIIKHTSERTHKAASKNTKPSKGEQVDELHKIKIKPDMKRKHGKKQNITEKTVSDALQSSLVQVGEPNTKESVMARMIEIDLQIHKLMTEKMKLYQLLESNAVPSEATLDNATPMPASDVQSTSGPSVVATQLVQKIDMSSVLHQSVCTTNEMTGQHNLHSTSTVKRKSSSRREHGHRKRIALSYSSDEEDTRSVANKNISFKDDGVAGFESSSRAKTTTPEQMMDKKRHSETSSHSDGAKSLSQKIGSDVKEMHSDKKSAKGYKHLSTSAEKKTSKRTHKDKAITVKSSVLNPDTNVIRRKSETDSNDNNEILIHSKESKSDKRSTDTCMPAQCKGENTNAKSEETKTQSIRITNDNSLSQAQNVKSCEDVLGNEYDVKKPLLGDTSLEDKATISNRSIREARTSEGLSIYSDDSTWESFPQNAPVDSNDQKKPNTGLALLEMSYRKEMAKSRKLKAMARKKKKKQSESVQSVNSLASDEEELSLSALYMKKHHHRKNVLDSEDSNGEDSSNLNNLTNSQNLDDIINAVAEDRVQDLYAKRQPVVQEESTMPETEIHTEASQQNCDIPKIENDSKLKLDTPASETDRLEHNANTSIGEDNSKLRLAQNAVHKHSVQVKQNNDLPTLEKSADLSENIINVDMHEMVDEHNPRIENQLDIEMPRLHPLNESSIGKSEPVTKSENFPTGNIEEECNFISVVELPKNTNNSRQTLTSCHEKIQVNSEPESLLEESSSVMGADSKINEETKFEIFCRKKKSEPTVIEESFKSERFRRDSAQSTDTMTTDSNSGTNQELPRRKCMKRKRKDNKIFVRKSSRLTDDNVKRVRLDSDTEGKVQGSIGKPVGSKSSEKLATPKQIPSVPSVSRRRSSSTSKLQNPRKQPSNAGDDMSTEKHIDMYNKQCEFQMYVRQLKNCEVRLVDSKYTLLKPNINPGVLRKYGISKINPYPEHSQNTGENRTLTLQPSLADNVPSTCTKQNTCVTEKNLHEIRELINDSSEIQVLKNIVKQEDSSKMKLQDFANDIATINERRQSSGDEISIIPTSNLQMANTSQGSEVPDIEIVEEVNPAKVHSQDGPESTLSVIETNDDEDPTRTQYTVHKGPILDIKVFGNTFLAASEDGTIYRYSQTTPGILNIYKGHKAAVTCLYIYTVGLPDSTKAWMFSGSLDGTLRCYNITTGTHIRDAVDIGSPIQCLDEAWGIIFVGTKSGHVSRYHIKSGVIKGESIQFSDKSVLALKATNEGSRRVLIVASRNQPITIRDAQNGLFLRTVSGQKSHTVYSLMRHNNLIYCGTSSTSIPVFDFTDGEEIVQYNAGVGIVCMRLYLNLLFAGCYDGNIYVFNTKDHRLICSTPGPGNMLLSMEIVDNKIIAGSKDRRLQLWQMPKQVRSLLLRET